MDALVEIERLSTLVKHQKIPTKSFDDLPEEVLLKICAYLSLQSLICCSGVSKRARRVCHDESLWQKINMYGKEVPSEFIKQTLANGCTYLSLQEAQIKGTLALPYKKYQLKYLNLTGLVANMKSVKGLLSCSFSIEKMSLSGLKLNKKILNLIIKNENLTVLYLSTCSELTKESIDKLITCDKLTELNLSYIKDLSRSPDREDIVNHLVRNLPLNLEKLCLRGIDCLSDDHVKILVNRCKKLTELDLFGSFDVTNIAYIIEKLPALVKLDVSLTNVGMDSINSISVKSLSNLKILNCLHLDLESLKSQLPNITISTERSNDLNIAIPSALIKEKDGFWDIKAKQIDLFSWNSAGTENEFSWQEKLREQTMS